MLAALAVPDMIVVVFCALMGVRGAFKGFAWTIIRFVGFLAAVAAALFGHTGFGAWIDAHVSFIPGMFAYVVAFAAILVGVWLLATYFAWVARGAVKRVNLGVVDRPLGFVAGGALGFLILTVVFLVLGASLTQWFPEAMDASVTPPLMREVAEGIESILPADLKEGLVQRVLDGLDNLPSAGEGGS